jgi:hypothetical protein
MFTFFWREAVLLRQKAGFIGATCQSPEDGLPVTLWFEAGVAGCGRFEEGAIDGYRCAQPICAARSYKLKVVSSFCKVAR